MVAPNAEDFTILSLPPARWREARALRLLALQTDADAFASSYADELAFADSVWISRLESAKAGAGNTTFFAEAQGELVGMAGAHWSDREKLRHVAGVYGVYVRPALRGRGIASALLRCLLRALRALPQIEKVSLSVNREELAAIALYEKQGFVIVGTARRELKVAGRYYDLHYMELLL